MCLTRGVVFRWSKGAQHFYTPKEKLFLLRIQNSIIGLHAVSICTPSIMILYIYYILSFIVQQHSTTIMYLSKSLDIPVLIVPLKLRT